jgi:chorismate lyase/3-hydroxybenzoate synthase
MIGDTQSIETLPHASFAAGGQTALRIFYRRPEPDQAPVDGYLLACLGFGEQGACESLERLTLPLPVIGEERWVEVWSIDRPATVRHAGGLLVAGNDDIVFGLVGPTLDDDIECATFEVYERIFEALRSDGALHLIRTWNFFSGINQKSDGVERYGLFCRGRHRALTRHLSDFEPSLPAASAIGTGVPGMFVCFLASRRAGVQIENPRQLSAFHYPATYAPKSPSFSRSILLKEADGRYRLYVSGTAAIVGHLSRYPGDLIGQVDETCENLEALLQSASVRAGAQLAFRLLRVYLREAVDTAPLRTILARRFGDGVPLLFVRGDICRNDLLVEVEGIAESGPVGTHRPSGARTDAAREEAPDRTR